MSKLDHSIFLKVLYALLYKFLLKLQHSQFHF